MKINARVKKLFTNDESDSSVERLQVVHYEYVEHDELPDEGGPWPFEVVAEGKSMRSLWKAFGSHVAARFDRTAAQAAQAILSGEDTGDYFTCQDETLLDFLRGLDEPEIVCAAFECLMHCRVSFRKAGKAIRSSHPDWAYRFEVSVVQMDDVYWVRQTPVEE